MRLGGGDGQTVDPRVAHSEAMRSSGGAVSERLGPSSRCGRRLKAEPKLG